MTNARGEIKYLIKVSCSFKKTSSDTKGILFGGSSLYLLESGSTLEQPWTDSLDSPILTSRSRTNVNQTFFLSRVLIYLKHTGKVQKIAIY